MKKDHSIIRFWQKLGPAPVKTAGAFLLLWWLAETARARYIFWPWALFDFFPGGTADPVRAILCLVCLLLCLWLGLTERGGRLRGKIAAFSRRRGGLWAISLLVTAAFFAWAMRVTVVSFMTNDDTAILRALASVPVRGLGAVPSFTNIIFCALLGPLYGLDPNGWWYAGYHLAALFFSCVIIGRCVLVRAQRRGLPLWAGCLICLFLFAGAIFPALSQLSFTVTPAVVGSAAVALILCRDEAGTAAGRAASDIASAALMFLCYIHREDTGRCLLCFWGLAVVYQAVRTLLRRDRLWKRRLIGLVVMAVCVPAIFSLCRSTDRSDAYYSGDYYYHERYRSIVMDYLADDLTPEELAAVGIPEELGNLLLKQWYFMDERINTETFRALSELYYNPVSEGASSDAGLIPSLLDSFFDEPETVAPMLYLAGATVALALLGVVTLLRQGKKYWLEFLCGLFALGGALLLCVYIMARGRFLYRVFLVIDIPALVIMTVCLLTSREDAHPRRTPVLTVCAAALGLTACALAVAVVCRTPYTTQYADRDMVFAVQRETETYADAYPDTLFITNFTAQNLDPFHGGSYPSNMFLWGGTGVTASEDRLYADAFFREDVRFMCQLPGSVALLLQYLTLDNGPVAARDEAHLTDNVYVFDLDRLTPGEDYTGWYDWNGMRYYFEDGQAVTGTKVIDGTEYEFSPAGAGAAMRVVAAEDGTYYATAAYAQLSP